MEREKAKFWVPPSLATDGGTPRGRTATRKASAPKPKFWTPEQLGLQERADFARWEGGAGTQWKLEERADGTRLVWYWHGDARPGGLCVSGLPAHPKRISVYLTVGFPEYRDRVLTELDPRTHDAAAGWCQSCDSGRCDGVRWAIAKLLQRNPIPF